MSRFQSDIEMWTACRILRTGCASRFSSSKTLLKMAEIGNLSSNTADFLPQFKAIGQSLKKRFFRKPNVSEAIEQYEALCQELQREEQKSFAAICCLEAAKCQENLRNFTQQANLLVKAGKLFLDARQAEKHFEDTFSDKIECNSLSGNLQLGVQCLNQAAKVYRNQKNYGIALVVTIQIGEVLYKEGDYGEALKYYKTALDITKIHFTFLDQLVIADLVIKAKVKMTEYESVSKTVSDTLIALGNHSHEEYPKKFINSYIQKFEIMRVILILIVGGNAVDMVKFIWPESSRTFVEEDGKGRGSDECGDTNVPKERREVLLHLKSLVLAVEHGSVNEINAVRNGLAPVLNETHHDLIYTLIQMLS